MPKHCKHDCRCGQHKPLCCVPPQHCKEACCCAKPSSPCQKPCEHHCKRDKPLPVFGQIEVCNCCDKPLRTENDQLSTSRDINGISAGTSIADLLAMLVTKDE